MLLQGMTEKSYFTWLMLNKSGIRETPTLWTDADSRTDTKRIDRPKKKSHGKGTNTQQTHFGTTRPTRPRGPSW